MNRADALSLLAGLVEAWDDTLTTHIYNADNGEHPDADELALVEKYREAVKVLAAPVRIVAGLEGGIVQGSSSDAPAVLLVLDYDTEGETDRLSPDVPQSNGETAEAVICAPGCELDPEWVAAVYAYDEARPE